MCLTVNMCVCERERERERERESEREREREMSYFVVTTPLVSSDLRSHVRE